MQAVAKRSDVRIPSACEARCGLVIPNAATVESRRKESRRAHGVARRNSIVASERAPSFEIGTEPDNSSGLAVGLTHVTPASRGLL